MSVFITSSPLVWSVIFSSSPLVSSVLFTSYPLVSSVFFTSSPLVPSVFWGGHGRSKNQYSRRQAKQYKNKTWKSCWNIKQSDILHPFRVWFRMFSTRFECSFLIFPTRFECKFQKAESTLSQLKDLLLKVVGSQSDVKLSSSAFAEMMKKRVETHKNTLETSGEDLKIHSKRVEKIWNSKRVEKM
jgi:hypothetical protein